MKWNWLKILAFVALLVFYGSVLVHQIALPAADDLPRQIKIGETLLQGNWNILYKNVYSYTEPEHTFYNHHWFSGVLFYLLFQVIGWSGLVVFKVAVFLAAFSLLFFTARKKADFWLVALCAVPTIIILLERTGLRPEVFCYLFITTYLYLLVDTEDHPERNWVYALIPLQLFWVNMHVFFSIGIMMTLGAFVEKAWNARKNGAWRTDPLVRKVGQVFLGVLAISVLNPRGVAGVFYRYPKGFPILISENQSLAQYLRQETLFEDPAILFFYVAVGILALSFLFAFRKKRVSLFYFFGALATTLLAFNILRGLSLFAILFLPSVTANLEPVFQTLKTRIVNAWPSYAGRLRAVAIGGFVLLCTLLTYPGWRAMTQYKSRGIGLMPWSSSSAQFFREHKLRGPIFNDADIGSYLIYELYPQERVFADNRFGDGYSAEFFGDVLLPALSTDDGWKAAMDTYNFNTIFYYHYDAATDSRGFLWRRLHDPEWVLVYGDPFAMILVRNTPENAEVIEQYRITPDNVEERLRPLAEGPTFGERASAADLFSLIGRPDLARKIFVNVVVQDPWRGRIWTVLGHMALDENTEATTMLALLMFQRAIETGRGTAEVYGLLGATYVRMGQTEKAIEALHRSLEINPERLDTQDLLRSITQFTLP